MGLKMKPSVYHSDQERFAESFTGPAVDHARDDPPPLREGEKLIARYDGFDHTTEGDTVLEMPTLGVEALVHGSVEHGFDIHISREFIEDDYHFDLTKDRMHFFDCMWWVKLADGRETIRSRAMLALSPLFEQEQKGYATWMDLVPSQILTIATEWRKQKVARELGLDRKRAIEQPPRWAGSRVFAPFYNALTDMGRYLLVKQREQKLNALATTRITARAALFDSFLHTASRAHLVKVDPQQVAVLPEWEEWEHLMDYADAATLPFEQTFFEFEDASGHAPHIKVSDRVDPGDFARLRGALVWRHFDGDHLVIAPIAWPDEFLEGRLAHPTHQSYSGFDPPGMVLFGKRLAVADAEIRHTAEILDMPGLVANLHAYDLADLYGIPSLVGTVYLTIDPDETKKMGMNDEMCRTWAQIVMSCAAKVAAAISITEAAEVELVEAPMERRDRKRAEKRGWKIAQQVVIRSSKRYLDRRPPSGEEAHYSHRFWVRAHVAHYPVGTRTADARPDLVRPCPRKVNPCGFCRIVKRPAHLKGPDDKPVVLKSLVKHGPS